MYFVCWIVLFSLVLLFRWHQSYIPVSTKKHKVQHVQDGIRRANQEVDRIGKNRNDPDGVLVPISGQGLGRDKLAMPGCWGS